MSNSIVRRTVWTTAGVWAVLILAVTIQSMLGVTVAGALAGSQPADNHDDAAVHGGNVRSSHWRGNVPSGGKAEPPALAASGESTERGETCTWNWRADVGRGGPGVAPHRRRGSTQTARFGMVRARVPQRRRDTLGCGHCSGARGQRQLLQRWCPAAGRRRLAADFTSGLDVVARRVMFQVWRAGAAGIHRNTLCQRTDLSPVELRTVVMRMGHVLLEVSAGAGPWRCRGRWRPTARCRATSSTYDFSRGGVRSVGREDAGPAVQTARYAPDDECVLFWAPGRMESVHRWLNTLLTDCRACWLCQSACGGDTDDRMVRRYAKCMTDTNTALVSHDHVRRHRHRNAERPRRMEERLRGQLERGELTMGKIRAHYATRLLSVGAWRQLGKDLRRPKALRQDATRSPNGPGKAECYR